ncbi:MAG: PEP-CTERM-box response regulator transcription factor [Alphaproteobacteria bacterium]|nr:PEP-CTERM-box response regulator transcription factor [Alphaproteobacteria bacterium]
MAKPKLLIVEDDEGIASQYRWAFPEYELFITHSRQQALTVSQKEAPDVALIDLGLPPDPDGVSEGFATLEQIQRVVPDIKAIVVTGNGEKPNALRAVSNGAYDFCEKPTEIQVLRTIVDRALRLRRLEEENKRLAALPQRSPIERIITANDAMLKVCRDIEKLAAANVPVLLLGESGTGKEALAHALHELGPRSKQPFVAINCGAIPENLLESELFGHERGAFTGAVKQTIGKIEGANKGTLFLDEIGDLPHPLQVKLLRFLQDQVIERIGGRQRIQVDVRIVSATNVGLEERVQSGAFRNDLFYRMNSVTVRIPPLRQRGGDVMLLANYFFGRFSREFGRTIKGFTDRAVAAITSHTWPGNVRELENRMKRAVIMAEGKLLDAGDLELEPAEDDGIGLDLRSARTRAEREVIQIALARSNGTLSTAARLLGVSRPTLYGLMELHGIEVEPTRGFDPSTPDTTVASKLDME